MTRRETFISINPIWKWGAGTVAAIGVAAALVGEATDSAAGGYLYIGLPGEERSLALGIGLGDKDDINRPLGPSHTDRDFPVAITIADFGAKASLGLPRTPDDLHGELIGPDEPVT